MPSSAISASLAAVHLALQLSAAPLEEFPVLAQPFDTEPFHPVRIPAWVEETTGAGYTLSAMSSDQRERAATAGVTLSELGFVDPFYAYFDSALLHRRSPHVPLDRLDHDLAEYRRLGVRVLAVVPPSLQSEIYAAHPEWHRVPTNTTDIPSIDLEQHPYGGMLCLLGPYGDFLIELVAEIAIRYPDVAAFSFDGLHYAGVCYCAECRDDHSRDTGREIPDVNMENPDFRRYQHWADRRLESLVRRMQTRLKGIRPALALVTWSTNAGRFGHLRDIPRNMPARLNLLFDAPDQEFWLDETNRGASVVPAFANAYAWAVTNHRAAFSEPYLMSHGNPYGKDSFPAHEVQRRMFLALTHGALPSIAVAQPAPLQDAVYQGLAEVAKRRPWLTHKKPESWAALVMSDNTRVFYGRDPGQVETRYLAHVFGWFRAALEEHLPCALINDWNLRSADLSPYRVLILPNTACLDDAQCAAIRGFVEQGGGLVASLDASLCDAFGDPRPALALGDLFGVRHGGVAAAGPAAAGIDDNFARDLSPEYWAARQNIWDLHGASTGPLGSPALHSLIGELPVTFKGPAIRVEPHTGVAVAASFAPKPGSEGAPSPAILTSTFGKGRVVYFTAGIDAAYYLYAYPYQRELLRNAVEWAAGSPPPIAVEAPMCVHAVAMRQHRDGERVIVHLYNDVNTTAFHALPDYDVPLREEVLPIHGIRVTFRGYPVRRVHLEPEGLELTLEGEAGALTVTVPRLDIHSMVIAELEP
ncbi:MAG TPA: beta-galactosidase trimerization domain-containing protein [Verrucomicrobiales bacterium]|nr:beta-galactosidase trimerization domain-containing protein [Verrucomicrobiales bacterium]